MSPVFWYMLLDPGWLWRVCLPCPADFQWHPLYDDKRVSGVALKPGQVAQ